MKGQTQVKDHMKTRIMLALLGLLAFRQLGFGERSERIGPDASAVAPKGLVEIVRHPSRVYRYDWDGKKDHASAATTFAAMARTTPEQAAEAILRGVEGGRTRILIGGDAHLLDWLVRLRPEGYFGLLRRLQAWVGRRGKKRK